MVHQCSPCVFNVIIMSHNWWHNIDEVYFQHDGCRAGQTQWETVWDTNRAGLRQIHHWWHNSKVRINDFCLIEHQKTIKVWWNFNIFGGYEYNDTSRYELYHLYTGYIIIYLRYLGWHIYPVTKVTWLWSYHSVSSHRSARNSI